MTCAGCGRERPDDAAFCPGCGRRFDDAGAAASTELADGTTALAGASATDGQRRTVTIMMSDLSGYTAMGERYDPEVVHDIMRTIKRDGTAIVESFGGIVNQFVGDEIVAFFGLPTAREDDARRAVLAAIAIHERVDELSARSETVDVPLVMHTGIHTGLLVAELADHRNGTYEVTGDAINTASRLLGLADRGELIVGSSTKDAIAPYFDIEPAGEHQVRNKRDPLLTYRIVGRRTGRTRFDVSRERGLTALSGRQAELEILDTVLAEVRTGTARAVVVDAPAGVGKSRLCFEFVDRELRRDPSIRTLKGRCQSYGSAVPYLPFVEILRSCFGVDPGDPAVVVADRVDAGLVGLGDEPRRFEEAYLHLLASLTAEELPDPWQGELLPDVLQRALVALIRALASTGPTVVQIEDWHWADDATRSLAARLMREAGDDPLMLLVTTRPGQAVADAVRGARTLVLEPLRHEATAAMLCAIEGATSVSSSLVDVVFESTLGNPFFVEELAASLNGAGQTRVVAGRLELVDAAERIAVPATVQAVVLERLDALGAELRDVVRVASVFGREFRVGMLSALLPDGQVESKLAELAARGFIETLSDVGVDWYRFRHVITQEVGYETLLLRERRPIHAAIARLIEEGQTESDVHLQRNVDALAHHHRLAGNSAQAIDYLEIAGHRATTRRALAEAREQLGLAIEETHRLEQSAATRARRAALTLAWARSCVFKPSATQTGPLETVRDEATADGAFDVALLASYWISWIHHSLGDQHAAAAPMQDLIPLLEAADEPSTLALVQCQLGQILWVQGRLHEADELFSAGIEQRMSAVRHGDDWSLEAVDPTFCYALAQHGLVRAAFGDRLGARTLVDLALELTVRTEDRATQASVRICDAIACVFTADWLPALATLAAIDDLPEPSVSPFVRTMALSLSGYALFRSGDRAAGLGRLEGGVAAHVSTEAQLALGYTEALRADALARCGRFDEAIEGARRSLRRSDVGDGVGRELAANVLLIATDRRGDALDRAVEQRCREADANATPHARMAADIAAAVAYRRAGDADRASEYRSRARDAADVSTGPGAGFVDSELAEWSFTSSTSDQHETSTL